MSLEIFKAGTFVAENGQTYSFSEDDVRASVAAYNPETFKAPLVVGHPKTDAPAYGWTASLSFSEDTKKVTAIPEQVNAEFAELVNAGTYPKISASFYPPNHPSNPVPGVYYLKHVGFLGGAAPAVKGLAMASFTEETDSLITIDFSDSGREMWWSAARIFRNLRDHFLSTTNAETADKIIPDYLVRSAEEAEFALRNQSRTGLSFSEPELNTMSQQNATADFAEQQAALTAREQALAAKEKALADKEREQANTETASFVEGLVKEGKLLPKDQAAITAVLASLDAQTTVSFAEGENTIEKPVAQTLRDFLSAQPQLVDFAEHSADKNHVDVASFAAPANTSVSTSRMELHKKIEAHAKANNMSYADAAIAVG